MKLGPLPPKKARITSLHIIACLAFNQPVLAFNFHQFWQDAFHTQDQQAAQLMAKQQYQEAAQRFDNTDWKAAATYRAGQYDQAAALYRAHPGLNNLYNLGNTLARSGKYQQAIKQYEKVLKQDPEQADARYNRDLLKKLLKEEEKKQKSEPNQQEQSDPSQPETKQPNSQPSTPSDDKKSSEQEPKPGSTPPKQPENQTPSSQEKNAPSPASSANKQDQTKENQQANKQWLKLVPDHPGGLLRQQFLRDHLKRIQGGSE